MILIWHISGQRSGPFGRSIEGFLMKNVIYGFVSLMVCAVSAIPVVRVLDIAHHGVNSVVAEVVIPPSGPSMLG
jgi:hypothetical protein